jgi:hypothetical protein
LFCGILKEIYENVIEQISGIIRDLSFAYKGEGEREAGKNKRTTPWREGHGH